MPDQNKRHRPIRSFARRVGRITERQKTALESLLPKYGIEFTTEQLDLNKAFNQAAPLNIEIGFGMGEALIAMASQNPHENYLGIEVHTPGIGNLLNQIDLLKLGNIRIIAYDAVEVLKHQIPEHSVNCFCIFFSDPWHKSKHHKRRLINASFVKLLATKLNPQGKIYLATDWENYAQQMLRVFSENKSFRNLSPNKDYCPRIAFRPLTKFEKRGHRLGHEVWDLIFEKTEANIKT
ncbi:MAG TPA: tRNA (guanosine(46)-N7)-methyltransferase TrmB [Gammaproteobacteria bacterium]|nr:tRNA (guanosine(46)-N7)-methyltransferase TrmB [Gammaproteobacteria bacterium]